MSKRDEVLEIVAHIHNEAIVRDDSGKVSLTLAMASLAAEHMPARKRKLWLEQLRGVEDGNEKT